jgi:uncharacterized protein YodC (DUF2158 family)
MEIKIGDVVILKSGGPEMTVTAVGQLAGSPDQAKCIWFANGEAKESIFSQGALKKIR